MRSLSYLIAALIIVGIVDGAPLLGAHEQESTAKFQQEPLNLEYQLPLQIHPPQLRMVCFCPLNLRRKAHPILPEVTNLPPQEIVPPMLKGLNIKQMIPTLNEQI